MVSVAVFMSVTGLYGLLFRETDDLLWNAAVRLRGDLQLHLNGAEDLASLSGNGVALSGLLLAVSDFFKRIPERALEVGCGEFGCS